MRCCEKCFDDEHLKRYIRQHGRLGSCKYCGSRRVHVIEAGELEDLFSRFTSIYSPLQPGINAPPDVDIFRIGDRLGTIIQDNWEIFSEKLMDHEEAHHDLLEEILTATLHNEELLDAPDINDLWTERNWLHNSLLDRWEELSEQLKHPEERQPIAPDLVPDAGDYAGAVDTLQWFEEDIGRSVITLPAGTAVYRVRLGYRVEDYRTVPIPVAEMGAPPTAAVTQPGRANPVSVSYLYAADDEGTAVAEKRPHRGALVTVAAGRTRQELRLVDLQSGMYLKSPFECNGDYLSSIVESCELFNHLNAQFAEPLRHTDDVHEYLPTLFFAEWVKDHHYHGIRYGSAMSEGGTNVVLFDVAAVEFTTVRLVRVDSVEVEYSDYNPDG